MQILQYLEHTLLKNYCCSSEIPIQLSVLCFRLLNLPTPDMVKEPPVIQSAKARNEAEILKNQSHPQTVSLLGRQAREKVFQQ